MTLKEDRLEIMLMRYVRAAGRMRDDWQEGDTKVKNQLWRNLHALEDDARELIGDRMNKFAEQDKIK